MSVTKQEYTKYSDKIWDKRFNSPYLIRRYIHRTQYFSMLKYINSNENVLDIGCGEGVFSCLMAQKGIKVIACDISIPNIENAKNMAKNLGVDDKIQFLIADAENLPFKDNSFNMVISSHVLEHLPDFFKGLNEIKRITRDKALIAVPTCLSPSSMVILGGDNPWKISKKTPFAIFKGLYLIIRNLFNEGVYEKYGGKDDFPHLWFYPWELKKRLKQTGFKILKIEAASLCLPYISYLIPQTIILMKVMDKIKDNFPFNLLGYGTFVLVENQINN